LGVGAGIVGEGLLPGRVEPGAALADAALKRVTDAVGHQELGVLRPAVEALGLADFLLAKRVAMGGGGALLAGRAVADDAVDDDQGRLAFGRLELLQRLPDRGAV